jgi:hypothetical protein
MIHVEKPSDNRFKVTVANGSTTTHTVTVSDDTYQKLTGGAVPPETLVGRSFGATRDMGNSLVRGHR